MAYDNPLDMEFSFISLARFALPSMAMMIFMGLYTVTDTIFISRFINTDALSAVNIVCPVMNIMVGVGTMLATGGNAEVSQKMGAGDRVAANKAFTLIFIFAVILGIIAAVAGTVFIDNIVYALGANSELFSYCKNYLTVIFLFSPACFMQTLLQNFVVTAGRPRLGLKMAAGAGAANILLDYIFIVKMNMGITGAALGTGVGYMLPTVLGIIFFAGGSGELSFRKPASDLSILAKSCANGFSEMAGQASAAVTTFFFNRTMMELLGTKGVAAITIIIYLQFLMTSLYIGFSMGAAPIIGFNFGAKNRLRLKRLFMLCHEFTAACSAAVFLISFFCGEKIVGIFAGGEVFNIAKEGIKIFSFSFIFSGYNILTSAMLTAMSKGKESAEISVLRTFLLIMAGLYFLPKLFGVNGVWLAVPLAEALSFIFAACIFRRTKKELMRKG